MTPMPTPVDPHRPSAPTGDAGQSASGNASKALRSAVRQAQMASICFAALLVLMGSVVHVHGAIIASGTVAVESKVKRVSHPTGGVIAAILVHDGDRVRQGQPLIRLDTSVSQTTASATGESLQAMVAERARIEAERDGRDIVVPKEIHALGPDAETAMDEERRLFEVRRTARIEEHGQIRQRVSQAEQEIASLNAQIDSAKRQRDLIEGERKGIGDLYAKGFAPLTRKNEIERTAIDLESTRSALEAKIAETRAKIAELREQDIQIDQEARTHAGDAANDLDGRLGDARSKAAGAHDAFTRSVIKAPADGIVDKLAYTTIGSVIPANVDIVTVVPDRDRDIVEAHIRPEDVDQVRVNQRATMKFTAFNAQTTPEVHGHVTWVSAQHVQDERAGAAPPYYVVRIAIDPGETRKLNGLTLIPDMPVETFIETTSRSLLSYVLRPLHDQIDRAFREGDR